MFEALYIEKMSRITYLIVCFKVMGYYQTHELDTALFNQSIQTQF